MIHASLLNYTQRTYKWTPTLGRLHLKTFGNITNIILWRISGKMVKRQVAAKSQSEIYAALKVLSEMDCMPIFLTTSKIVS